MKAREMNTLVSKGTYKMKLERSSQAVTQEIHHHVIDTLRDTDTK